MSGVHDSIAMNAFSRLSKNERELFEPYEAELKETSWYPDYFADKSMPQKDKDKIDPDADKFIYPDPPKSAWQCRFEKMASKQTYSDAPPLKQVYLIRHYLKNAVASLKAGDVKSAVKFCGVYSHVIADICEPIHALSPAMLDIIVPPPQEYIGLELHANVEGLQAPIDIKDYKPKLLGQNLEQAEMGAFAGLIKAHKFGTAQATPIVQALYAGNKGEARALSGKAQSESARHFADFMHTVCALALSETKEKPFALDLRGHPFVECNVDMLYRYAPTIDVSLVPYSGGKLVPLELKNENGKNEKVKGLGVVPCLGPPFAKDTIRETSIEYCITPGAFKKFTARVGLNPKFSDSVSSAVFSILGDGKELARSAIIEPSAPAVRLEVEIGKIRWLTLSMHYARNPMREDLDRVKKLAWISHGVWAEPQLS